MTKTITRCTIPADSMFNLGVVGIRETRKALAYKDSQGNVIRTRPSIHAVLFVCTCSATFTDGNHPKDYDAPAANWSEQRQREQGCATLHAGHNLDRRTNMTMGTTAFNGHVANRTHRAYLLSVLEDQKTDLLAQLESINEQLAEADALPY